jgi:alpha-D-ribose 1-methylphosphonate 5-triphosphate synthase subunit PhnH
MAFSILPTADDSRTNAVFEELMWALSRPGLVRTLPGGGFSTMAESLVDRECTFHVAANADLDQALALTGARRATIANADYVFASLAIADEICDLSALRLGTLAYPDEAATLFAPVRLGSGQQLRLSGPGIKDSLCVAIDGIDASFWQLRDKAIRYPLGFDLYLVDGDHVVGIPRSTKVEVL